MVVVMVVVEGNLMNSKNAVKELRLPHIYSLLIKAF